MSDTTDINQLQLQAAAELPPDKKFYFNGFTIAVSPMDCAIVLLHNNQPIAFLSTSHTVAKSLAVGIDGLVRGFEEKTGLRIPTLDEARALLEREVS